jgi:hypothetical protein
MRKATNVLDRPEETMAPTAGRVGEMLAGWLALVPIRHNGMVLGLLILGSYRHDEILSRTRVGHRDDCGIKEKLKLKDSSELLQLAIRWNQEH